jgi:hypothetical protein
MSSLSLSLACVVLCGSQHRLRGAHGGLVGLVVFDRENWAKFCGYAIEAQNYIKSFSQIKSKIRGNILDWS